MHASVRCMCVLYTYMYPAHTCKRFALHPPVGWTLGDTAWTLGGAAASWESPRGQPNLTFSQGTLFSLLFPPFRRCVRCVVVCACRYVCVYTVSVCIVAQVTLTSYAKVFSAWAGSVILLVTCYRSSWGHSWAIVQRVLTRWPVGGCISTLPNSCSNTSLGRRIVHTCSCTRCHVGVCTRVHVQLVHVCCCLLMCDVLLTR